MINPRSLAIPSPLPNPICGGIAAGNLSAEEAEVRAVAMECVMEIGSFGRKKAVEAVINGGMIWKLADLHSSEGARLAVQLEVGEGLRHIEKGVVKADHRHSPATSVSSVADSGDTTSSNDDSCSTRAAVTLNFDIIVDRDRGLVMRELFPASGLGKLKLQMSDPVSRTEVQPPRNSRRGPGREARNTEVLRIRETGRWESIWSMIICIF